MTSQECLCAVFTKLGNVAWAKRLAAGTLSPGSVGRIRDALPAGTTRQLGKAMLGSGAEGIVVPSFTTGHGLSATKLFSPKFFRSREAFRDGGWSDLSVTDRYGVMRDYPNFFPEILSIDGTPKSGPSRVVMERLYPIPKAQRPESFSSVLDGLWTSKVPGLRKSLVASDFWQHGSKMPFLERVLHRFRKPSTRIFDRFGANFELPHKGRVIDVGDVHASNIMRRADGTVVISDPIMSSIKNSNVAWARQLAAGKLGPASISRLTKAMTPGITRQTGPALGKGIEGSVFPSFTTGVGPTAVKRFETDFSFMGIPERAKFMNSYPSIFPKVYNTTRDGEGWIMDRLYPLKKPGPAIRDLSQRVGEVIGPRGRKYVAAEAARADRRDGNFLGSLMSRITHGLGLSSSSSRVFEKRTPLRNPRFMMKHDGRNMVVDDLHSNNIMADASGRALISDPVPGPYEQLFRSNVIKSSSWTNAVRDGKTAAVNVELLDLFFKVASAAPMPEELEDPNVPKKKKGMRLSTKLMLGGLGAAGLGTFMFAPGARSAINKFRHQADGWSVFGDGKKQIAEYVDNSVNALAAARPFGFDPVSVLKAIRSIPGLPPSLSWKDDSITHYNSFRKGQMSGYQQYMDENITNGKLPKSFRGQMNRAMDRYSLISTGRLNKNTTPDQQRWLFEGMMRPETLNPIQRLVLGRSFLEKNKQYAERIGKEVIPFSGKLYSKELMGPLLNLQTALQVGGVGALGIGGALALAERERQKDEEEERAMAGRI